MDEAVTHYINSHPADEAVHVDANTLALNVQDDGGSRVSILHSQTFSTSMCRQVSVGDQVAEGQWSEELIDPEGRLAALMAHITGQQSRAPPLQMHHKVHTVRGDVDTSIILDNSMRLFHGQPMDQSQDPIIVEVPQLPPLPPLQEMKRCQDSSSWYHDKAKPSLKDDSSMVDSDGPVLDMGAAASPAHHKHQNKKSLPHKKRISRKLKKNNGNSTPQQDIVVISCRDVDGRISCATHAQEQEILPDTFVPHEHLHEDAHHITHEVRPIFICQLCGEFYGEEQLKFFQHLKQHYEPHIIIENPVPDLGIDKMTNSCIVDNVATIPDSIVELSLENSIPKTMYQPIDKHVLYTTSDKTLTYTNNKVQYSMASMDKEPTVVQEAEKTDLYDTLDKLDLFSCGKCSKSFRKQKQCEAHIKEAHSNMKHEYKPPRQLEDMGEFSEPEDLMEGIHVAVDEPSEHYEHTLLPHLTVENGHAHQENVRHWYVRAPAGGPHGARAPSPQHLKLLKEEVLRRILETDVANDSQNFSDNMMPDATEPEPVEMADEPRVDPKSDDNKKKQKKFECQQCSRVFLHRNSLLYHMLSHSGKQQMCRECGKGFYTVAALKIHKRVHNGDRPYKCDVCGRDFRQWSDLKYHKVSIHSDQKMFKCEFCSKEFARKYSLNVHRRIHTGERNYKCEYCNKSFRASSYRLSHMRTHTGDKPHKCPQCDKCFRVTGDLRRHMLIHDKVRNRLNEQKTKPKDNKEPKKLDKLDDPEPPAVKNEPTINIKKFAVASTSKPLTVVKTIDKKTKPAKKNQTNKKGAPNVTIDQLDNSYTNNVEVFDTRQDTHYGKFKEVYNDTTYNKDDLDNPFTKQIIEFKNEQVEERELAILRPMFRNNVLCDNVDADKTVFRTENTDGKMQVYTHIEKTNNTILPNPQVALNDMRHLERDVRNDIHGETMENGFIERLTALYNIPAV